jgi:hypothetical protein
MLVTVDIIIVVMVVMMMVRMMMVLMIMVLSGPRWRCRLSNVYVRSCVWKGMAHYYIKS